jgi:hypothetical protein
MLTPLIATLLIGSLVLIAAGWIGDLLRERSEIHSHGRMMGAETDPDDPYKSWTMDALRPRAVEDASFLSSPRRF